MPADPVHSIHILKKQLISIHQNFPVQSDIFENIVLSGQQSKTWNYSIYIEKKAADSHICEDVSNDIVIMKFH